MKSEYKAKDMGELRWILGMHLTRNREHRTGTLTQTKYIEDMKQKFKIPERQSTTRVGTPALIGDRILKEWSRAIVTKKKA